MAQQVTLRDGTAALIWPLLPTDSAGLQEHYADLSIDSRYNRFLSAPPALSDHLLQVLVNDVDGKDHVALVLFAFPDQDREQAAGVARMIRYREDPTSADVAVTVAEHWQGRGVASALLAELVRQRPAGVDQIATQVAASNQASFAMLARLGATRTTAAGSGVRDVHVQLALTDMPSRSSRGTAWDRPYADRP